MAKHFEIVTEQQVSGLWMCWVYSRRTGKLLGSASAGWADNAEAEAMSLARKAVRG